MAVAPNGRAEDENEVVNPTPAAAVAATSAYAVDESVLAIGWRWELP